MLTGDMLRNFQVRTVSENKAKASNSTRKDRIKAWITNKIEPWIVFSPKNRTAVLDATNRSPGREQIAPGGGEAPSAVSNYDRPLEIVDNLVAHAARHPGAGRPRWAAIRRASMHTTTQYPKNVSLAHAIHQMPVAVDHGRLAGHAARRVRRRGRVEAPDHAVPARAGDVRRRPADCLLPAVPADHQGRPDGGGHRDDQRHRSPLLLSDGPAARFSGRPMRRGWTTSKCHFHSRRLETTEWTKSG